MMPRVATGIRCAHRLRDPLSASAGRFLGRDNPVCALDAGTRALLGRDRGRLSAASCVRLACVMSCRQRSPGRIITLRTPAPNVIAPLKQSVTCRIHATARDVPWRALVGIRAEVRLDQHGPVERDHRGPKAKVVLRACNGDIADMIGGGFAEQPRGVLTMAELILQDPAAHRPFHANATSSTLASNDHRHHNLKNK